MLLIDFVKIHSERYLGGKMQRARLMQTQLKLISQPQEKYANKLLKCFTKEKRKGKIITEIKTLLKEKQMLKTEYLNCKENFILRRTREEKVERKFIKNIQH